MRQPTLFLLRDTGIAPFVLLHVIQKHEVSFGVQLGDEGA